MIKLTLEGEVEEIKRLMMFLKQLEKLSEIKIMDNSENCLEDKRNDEHSKLHINIDSSKDIIEKKTGGILKEKDWQPIVEDIINAGPKRLERLIAIEKNRIEEEKWYTEREPYFFEAEAIKGLIFDVLKMRNYKPSEEAIKLITESVEYKNIGILFEMLVKRLPNSKCYDDLGIEEFVESNL